MPASNSHKSTNSAPAPTVVTWRQWFLSTVIGTSLSLLMWQGLLQGNDLTGGDTWPYFFPQKTVLAESFANHELPLWHDLTGLGYPLLAESQAGVFYPTNQILYRVTSINRAYYISIVLHYAFAFIFAWRFVRCQQVSNWPALLAAMIFVYGWFPARISLEWSIIGGVWLPLTLWLTHDFLQRPSPWRFAMLSTCLGIHLLAGHFTLAFINQLCLVLYAALQLLVGPKDNRPKLLTAAAIPAAVIVGLVIGAAQLLPSMELKQVSQREGARTAFKPGYGHMPPLYLTQLVGSWSWWHSPEILQSGQMQRLPGSMPYDTNAVEAHFYLGLIPLALAALCLLPGRRRYMPSAEYLTWLILGACSIVYATGWLLPVTQHLPGFSYFMGPGRYTIVATLAGAILCGLTLDSLMRPQSLAAAVLLIGVITWFDLSWSSKPVADAIEVPPILKHEDESWVRQYFQEQPPRTCRLLASGPNVANLFGVSCVPQYLGIGPAVYFSDAFDLATQPDDEQFATPEQLERLQALGVTHVLTTEPAIQSNAALESVGARPDALLNRIWGRGGSPCYLYRLRSPGQRLVTDPPSAMTSWKTIQESPTDIMFEVTLNSAAQVHLRELMYPGWTAEIDGQPVDAITGNDLTRTVHVAAGAHQLHWKFESRSVHTGIWVSFLALLGVWSFGLLPWRRTSQEKVG